MRLQTYGQNGQFNIVIMMSVSCSYNNAALRLGIQDGKNIKSQVNHRRLDTSPENYSSFISEELVYKEVNKFQFA